jgi:hypothetical protein
MLRLGFESKEHRPHCGVHQVSLAAGRVYVLTKDNTSERAVTSMNTGKLM